LSTNKPTRDRWLRWRRWGNGFPKSLKVHVELGCTVNLPLFEVLMVMVVICLWNKGVADE